MRVHTAGVKWSPDGACFLTASDDNWWGPALSEPRRLRPWRSYTSSQHSDNDVPLTCWASRVQGLSPERAGRALGLCSGLCTVNMPASTGFAHKPWGGVSNPEAGSRGTVCAKALARVQQQACATAPLEAFKTPGWKHRAPHCASQPYMRK